MTKFTRAIILFAFCCLIIAIKALNSGKYQNDLKDRNLKGKVKSCIEFHYDSYKASDEIDSGWVYSTTDTFDIKGNTISSDISGNPSKRPVSRHLYWVDIRDNEDRKIETKGTSGKIISRSTYDRNAENNLVESIWFESSSKPMLKIIYNHSGRRDTMYNYDIVGGFMGIVVYRYNKSNDLIEQNSYSPKGKLTSKEVYDYDKNNLKISEMHYDSLGIKNSKINYAYDDYGNMTMEADSSMMYIGGNRVFNADSTNKNILIFRCTFGNFDSHHNWLREDMLYNNKIVKTYKRKIEYYP
ncbi:MAG: hypothetical protein ABI166_14135 [Mucilaginibacter sp.]